MTGAPDTELLILLYLVVLSSITDRLRPRDRTKLWFDRKERLNCWLNSRQVRYLYESLQTPRIACVRSVCLNFKDGLYHIRERACWKAVWFRLWYVLPIEANWLNACSRAAGWSSICINCRFVWSPCRAENWTPHRAWYSSEIHEYKGDGLLTYASTQYTCGRKQDLCPSGNIGDLSLAPEYKICGYTSDGAFCRLTQLQSKKGIHNM